MEATQNKVCPACWCRVKSSALQKLETRFLQWLSSNVIHSLRGAFPAYAMCCDSLPSSDHFLPFMAFRDLPSAQHPAAASPARVKVLTGASWSCMIGAPNLSLLLLLCPLLVHCGQISLSSTFPRSTYPFSQAVLTVSPSQWQFHRSSRICLCFFFFSFSSVPT